MMKKQLIGPFTQLIALQSLPLRGAIQDDQVKPIRQGGLVVEHARIVYIGEYDQLRQRYGSDVEHVTIQNPSVCLPGYIDCHTHIAFAGSRANDYALRNAGASYLEIAEAGGGIWSTVRHTRDATVEELAALTVQRAKQLIQQGVTTLEIKSGYGLSLEEEIKILRAIKLSAQQLPIDIIPTCLAAHMKPSDFSGSASAYLQAIADKLFPVLRDENLSDRIDIFVERSAFSIEEAEPYLSLAKERGFDIVVHADQFTPGASELAVRLGAVSADHLEASTEAAIRLLGQADTVSVVLPGASMGLGCGYAPARRLLDAGACVAIATDWNPGSAPMGQLMTQASVLAAAEKLTTAELLAGITFRAAKALSLTDRGTLEVGKLADFNIYPTDNYQDIAYLQGTLKPQQVWKNGRLIFEQGGQS